MARRAPECADFSARTLAGRARHRIPAVIDRLRELGYPAPRIELAVQLQDVVVLVQELLPGRKIDHLDAGLLEQGLVLNGLQAGALAARPEVRPLDLHLREDGPGFCLHGPLRAYSRRSARLQQWVAEAGVVHPSTLAGDDAIHFDFHPGNLLEQAGRVSGVVDWDGACRGDHRFDLVTLRFGLLPKSIVPSVLGRLDGIPPDVLRPAWAHMSLRMTDWAIRHFAASEVEQWMDLAEQRASAHL
ncbi:MAG: phosphotransferase [Pseudonocardiaceae bacterium]